MGKQNVTLRRIFWLLCWFALSSCSDGQQSSSSSSVITIPQGALEIFSPKAGVHTTKKSLVVSGICAPGYSVILSGDLISRTSTTCIEQEIGSIEFGTFSKKVEFLGEDGSKRDCYYSNAAQMEKSLKTLFV